MELKDTVNLMCSDDWRARFKGEYLQTKIRLDNLNEFLNKSKPSILDDYAVNLMKLQAEIMSSYLAILQARIRFHALTNYVETPLDKDGF